MIDQAVITASTTISIVFFGGALGATGTICVWLTRKLTNVENELAYLRRINVECLARMEKFEREGWTETKQRLRELEWVHHNQTFTLPSQKDLGSGG